MRIKPTARDVQMLDGEAIFATRIIENFPQMVCKQAFVVLKHDENAAFTPLVGQTVPPRRKVLPSFADEMKQLQADKEAEKEAAKPQHVLNNLKKGKKHWRDYIPKMPSKVKDFLHRFTGGLLGGGSAKKRDDEEGGALSNVSDESAYTNQPRYAMSHCIVGSSVTYLVAATYYNQTIPQLLDLFTDKDFLVVAVSIQWVGKEYGYIFEHLLKTKDLLSVGIYRQTTSEDIGVPNVLGAEGQPPPGYIFTAPPVDEPLCRNDRLLCMLADEPVVK